MTNQSFPDPTHLSRSWVVYHADGSIMMEVFDRALAKQAHDRGFKVVLIGDHLAGLNVGNNDR